MNFITRGAKIRIEDIDSQKLLLEATISRIEKDRLYLFVEDDALKSNLIEDDNIFCKVVTKLGVRLFDSVVLDLSIPNYITIDYNPDDYKLFQRRKFIRVNANISGIIVDGNEFYKIKTLDLGGGGIKFYSEKELPLDKTVQLRIRLNSNEPFIVVSGKIVKHSYYKENEYLFFFTEINENHRSKIIKKCLEVQSSDIREILDNNDSNDK